jgi:hypothetical protein
LSGQYKEENRNLGIILRDLRIQFSDSQATVQCLKFEKERLAHQLNSACDASGRRENEDQWLKGEQDAPARKQTANLYHNKSDRIMLTQMKAKDENIATVTLSGEQ